MRARSILAVAAAAMAWIAVTAPAAGAAPTRFEWLKGYDAPQTPAAYDKVGVLQTGSRKAKNVLVLIPGTSASAAYFEPLAQQIVDVAPAWQVWSVERRENLLEDQSVADAAKAGRATPQQLFDFYLGRLSNPQTRRSTRARATPASHSAASVEPAAIPRAHRQALSAPPRAARSARGPPP